MAREFSNSNPINYLKINIEGLLYLGSKVEKEGYKPVKLQNDRIVYHKTFASTDDGYLDYLGITEKEFDGKKIKQLVLTIKGEKESDSISVDLFKSNGAMEDYVKNLATLLPNLDFSKSINIVPSRKKNDRGYVDRAFFINYTGEQGDGSFVKFAHKFGKEGNIPPAEKKTKVDGTVSYDFTEQDTYLYNILTAEIERFKAFKGVNSNQAKPKVEEPQQENIPLTSAPSANPTDSMKEEEHDDLPF